MTNKRKNIIVLSKWYPTPAYATAGIFVRRHALAALPYHNMIVLYAASKANCARGSLYLQEYNHEGLVEVRVFYAKNITGISSIDKAIKMLYYFLAVAKGFYFIKKKHKKIDLIHATVLLRTGIAAYLIQKFHRIPYLITEHSTIYQESVGNFRGRLRKYLTRKVIKKARTVTTVSLDLERAMRFHGLNNNYTRIFNVVNTDFFRPKRKNVSPPLRLVCVAMLLDKHKNISGILTALASLKNRYSLEIQLDILGKGKDRNTLEALADSLGLVDNVTFWGLQTPQVVRDRMQEAHALILFSNYENSPCVIPEAFACGTPVIATDVGGIKEMLQDPRLGFLIEKGDESALEDAILSLTKVNFDAEFIRTYALAHFSMEAIGLQLDNAYRLHVL